MTGARFTVRPWPPKDRKVRVLSEVIDASPRGEWLTSGERVIEAEKIILGLLAHGYEIQKIEQNTTYPTDSLNDVLAWLNDGLAKALVVDGPEGIAKAAWVPIDRVLLARDRLAVIIAHEDDDLDAMAPGNFV